MITLDPVALVKLCKLARALGLGRTGGTGIAGKVLGFRPEVFRGEGTAFTLAVVDVRTGGMGGVEGEFRLTGGKGIVARVGEGGTG
jgi:hypothetical protein